MKDNKSLEAVRENVHFVLVAPESPGNVGAAARALKTMGFRKLVLVLGRPFDARDQMLVKMAHRSLEIVEGAAVFPSLELALAPMRMTAATSMRRRRSGFPCLTPRELSEKLVSVAAAHPVAVVFGREATGLTNHELHLCHLLSSIPTAARSPSVNLAQAVMIYAHTLFLSMQGPITPCVYDLATHEELESLYDHLAKSLDRAGFAAWDGMENFTARFRRLLGRSMPERRDVRLLHKLLRVLRPGPE